MARKPSSVGILAATVLVFMACTGRVSGCGRGAITINNNEYRQILVAIGDNVPENSELVERIQEVFTSASGFLYQATKKRAFFKDITILIPDTWSDKAEYQAAGKETFDKSDIVVDEQDSRFQHGNRPFVIKTTPCGELGYYMHLTPSYLLDAKTADEFGPYEKTIVHEWAHLRYGVYEEYPADEGGLHFYAGVDGEIEPTRCSRAIKGTWYNAKTGRDRCAFVDNFPEPDCRFRDEAQQAGDFGSLMYRQYINHVTEFCDNDPSSPLTLHNSEAPTQQNQLCESRSVWEVMRSHPDFSTGCSGSVCNPPREVSDTTPDFTIIRRKSTGRVVLVLDVSGSMGPSYPGDKLVKMGQGVNNYISNIVRQNDKLGIVIFNATAYSVKDLTVISDQTRVELLGYIPTLARGGTTIGGGIREGIRMLSRDSDGTNGGTLIVVTDGEEQSPPLIEDVVEETLAANITLHSIAITNDADSKLDAIAMATGGLPFLYSANDNSNALNEAFQTIGELNSNLADRKYTLLSQAVEIQGNGGVYEDLISIDSSLGRGTEFIFDHSKADIDVTLTSPAGNVFNKTSNIASRDSTFGIYRFKPTGVAEPGKWTYRVTNTQTTNQRVAVSLTSQTAQADLYPIIAQAFWGKRNMDSVVPGPNPALQRLYASVSQGYAAVLRADVMASVERPGNAPPVDVMLLDNGAGSDLVKDDGIYSAYFFQFNSRGRYNVKVFVNSTDATVVSPRRIIGQSAAVIPSESEEQLDDIPTELFQRTASGGSFELGSYTADPSGKIYPPGRIIDLIATGANYELQTVTLQWTAVGDQLDSGTASAYELRMANSSSGILTDFASQTLVTDDMVVSGGNLSRPLAAGERELFVISVPANGDVAYAFGVVARDLDGRDSTGPVSNTASASLRYFPPDSGTNVGLIVGVVIGVLIVIGLVTALALVVVQYNKNKKSDSVGRDNPVSDQMASVESAVKMPTTATNQMFRSRGVISVT